MADPTNVNSQIASSINAVQQAVMTSQVVKTSGAGKAYQSVSQSCAIAVQDATDYLRNVGTIMTTALGVASAEYLATKNPEYLTFMTSTVPTVMENAAKHFATVGKDAGTTLSNFPSG